MGAGDLYYWLWMLAHRSLSALILGREDVCQLLLSPAYSGEYGDLGVGAFHSCRILLSDCFAVGKLLVIWWNLGWQIFFRSGSNYNETMWCGLAGIHVVRSRVSLICTFAKAGNAVPVTLSCLFILSWSSSLARMPVHGREPGMVKNEKEQKEGLKTYF